MPQAIRQFLLFTTGVGLFAFLLLQIPYSKQMLSQFRLEKSHGYQLGQWTQKVSSQCGELISSRKTPWSAFFLLQGSPSPDSKGPVCELWVQSATSSRMGLLQKTSLSLQVSSLDSNIHLKEHFFITAPTPLVVLPLFAFGLAKWASIPFSYTFMVVLFLVGLEGGSLLGALGSVKQTLVHAVKSNPNLLGVLSLLVWIALNLSVRSPYQNQHLETRPTSRWANRLIMAFVGLWSPLVYTTACRMLLKKGKSGLLFLFDAQVVFLTLSLFFLNFDWSLAHPLKESDLFLPRYFSFALLFFTLLRMGVETPPRHFHLVWKFPFFWPSCLGVLVVESLALLYPTLYNIPFFVRVGTTSVVSCLWQWKIIDWKAGSQKSLVWASAFILSLFLAIEVHQSGLFDLAFAVMDPRKHPLVLTFFSFLTAFGLGFLTGNFAAVYFTLFAAMKSPSIPLLHAAIIDGVLAGMLLSPFSFFNLIPAVQFKMKDKDLIALRLKQITLPLLIGWMIYAVGTIPTLTILRPVTFVFLCLLALAFRLKKQEWRWLNRRPT